MNLDSVLKIFYQDDDLKIRQLLESSTHVKDATDLSNTVVHTGLKVMREGSFFKKIEVFFDIEKKTLLHQVIENPGISNLHRFTGMTMWLKKDRRYSPFDPHSTAEIGYVHINKGLYIYHNSNLTGNRVFQIDLSVFEQNFYDPRFEDEFDADLHLSTSRKVDYSRLENYLESCFVVSNKFGDDLMIDKFPVRKTFYHKPLFKEDDSKWRKSLQAFFAPAIKVAKFKHSNRLPKNYWKDELESWDEDFPGWHWGYGIENNQVGFLKIH